MYHLVLIALLNGAPTEVVIIGDSMRLSTCTTAVAFMQPQVNSEKFKFMCAEIEE